MKKLLMFGLVSLFVMGSTGTCFAGPYFSGNLAAVFGHDSEWTDSFGSGSFGEVTFDAGYGVSLALGNDLNDYRSEIELVYAESDFDEISGGTGLPTSSVDGDVASLAVMINLYKDFHNSSAVTPFIGAGIGGANVDIEIDALGWNNDDTVFAYQVALGISFNITDAAKIDLSYRYFDTTDPDLEVVDIDYFGASNIVAGFRMDF